MDTFSHVPPGFRFHPTDEELVDYYLRKKITSRRIDLDVIKDVDLYKIEPWDLQEICRIGTEEQSDWYFFSHKDKKYPTGTRTNRATAAGFWKATGRDKSIYSKHELIGMRKTLVFYKGRAPNGQKSDWIMHEYRLETEENGTPQEEGWVVCRVFKKRLATTVRRVIGDESPIWYDEHVSFMPDMESSQSSLSGHSQYPYLCKKETMINLHYQNIPPQNHFLQLPFLENPNIMTSNSSVPSFGLNSPSFHQPQEQAMHSVFDNNSSHEQDQVTTDWRVLDKFVASQLMSQDDQVSNATNTFHTATASDDSSFMVKQLDKQDWE